MRNGPPYLIFDDPISFIDDLNVLSFFDYLRETAINTEKQVFFATSNENLAFLFVQKFKFLGSDFKVYKLTRNKDSKSSNSQELQMNGFNLKNKEEISLKLNDLSSPELSLNLFKSKLNVLSYDKRIER